MDNKDIALQLTLKSIEAGLVKGVGDNEGNAEEVCKFYKLMCSLVSKREHTNSESPLPRTMVYKK